MHDYGRFPCNSNNAIFLNSSSNNVYLCLLSPLDAHRQPLMNKNPLGSLKLHNKSGLIKYATLNSIALYHKDLNMLNVTYSEVYHHRFWIQHYVSHDIRNNNLYGFVTV